MINCTCLFLELLRKVSPIFRISKGIFHFFVRFHLIIHDVSHFHLRLSSHTIEFVHFTFLLFICIFFSFPQEKFFIRWQITNIVRSSYWRDSNNVVWKEKFDHFHLKFFHWIWEREKEIFLMECIHPNEILIAEHNKENFFVAVESILKICIIIKYGTCKDFLVISFISAKSNNLRPNCGKILVSFISTVNWLFADVFLS